VCATVFDGVRGKMIGILDSYSPYVYFDRSNLRSTGEGRQLPAGRYRCTFLVNGKVVHSRTFSAAQALGRS
jgi:hypothetical protein